MQYDMKYYDLDEIPYIDESFSYYCSLSNRVISSVRGEFKVINCSTSVFRDVIGCIDGIKTFEQIETELKKKYPIDGVKAYIKVLISEKIIGINEYKNQSNDSIRALVFGKGILCDVVTASLNLIENIYIDNVVNHEQMESKLNEVNYDIACIVPEKATYSEMLSINKSLYASKVPYLPLYYNGQDIVAGPFILPGKTACYECQVRHHLSNINAKVSNDNMILLDNILSLVNAQKIPVEISLNDINFIGYIIRRDVENYISDKNNLELFENEIHFDLNKLKTVSEITFHPTTECKTCCGMNNNVVKWDSDYTSIIKNNALDNEEPIIYTVGGMRSLSESDSREKIIQALGGLKLDISIQRMSQSPFDSVLPVYRAFLKPRHNSQSNYYYREATTHGKGMTEQQSFLSASYELAEHISSYYLGDISIIQASYKEVEDKAIDIPYLNSTIYNHNTSFDTFHENKVIDWVWAQSLVSGTYKLVPASMVFLGDVKLQGQFINPSSSGLAAGATLSDAVLQGLYEVIEHDAWMIGQANTVILPSVDFMTSKNENLKNSINAVKTMGYDVIFRDYTNDLGFPVYRCWIVNKENYTHYATSGFGAAISSEIALERSFTEAIQSADVLVDYNKKYYGKASAGQLMNSADSFYSLAYFQYKDILGISNSIGLKENEKNFPSVYEVISHTVSKLCERLSGCDVLFVDLTKENLNIPAVRVIVTGDIQRLNLPLISVSRRMLEFPLKMGYSDKKSSLNELYMGPYPH